MKTICVTGGNGLLGGKVLAAALGRYRLVSVDLHETSTVSNQNLEYISSDITDKKRIYNDIVRSTPDCVIHGAAFTNVDGCERGRATVWDVNVRGTENVALACKALNIKMIHLSTDYVFDGKDGPYSEEDQPNPIGYYGITKLESEGVVRRLLEDYVIVRAMVLYGFAPGVRMNFVTWVVDRLRRGENISIVVDQYGTPTLADDLAEALLVIFEKDGTGIYHASGKEWMSRYDFTLRICEVFHLDPDLIVKTTTDRLNQAAPRPLRSGLKTDKIRREMGVRFSSVVDGLRTVKKQMEFE
ncbi:MAG: dTDP-4-dehydrorhamnose reductase [bacterium]